MPVLNRRNSDVFSNCSAVIGDGCVSPAPVCACTDIFRLSATSRLRFHCADQVFVGKPAADDLLHSGDEPR